MLRARNSIATIAVRNLEEARVYFEEKLGLEPARELPEGISYRTGGTTLLVYASRYAGTNQATCVTRAIDDVERVAQELSARGVTFELFTTFPERRWMATCTWRETGRRIPAASLSRVSSYDTLGSFVFMPVGFALAGPVADAAGLSATLLGMAGCAVATALALATLPAVRAVRRLGPRTAST